MIELQITLICLGCYKKCHSLGNLNSRHLVIIVLKPGNSKIKVPNYMVLSKGSLSGLQTVVFLCLHIWALHQEESWRTDTFELQCRRRLLRVPRTVRSSNQSVLKEINPEYSLEGLMLKLKLHLDPWCKEPTHWERSWCWEKLRAGGEGPTEHEMVGWHGQFSGLEFEKLQEMEKDREAWCALVHGVTESRSWLSGWATTTGRETERRKRQRHRRHKALYDLVSEAIKHHVTPEDQTRHWQRSTLFQQEAT